MIFKRKGGAVGRVYKDATGAKQGEKKFKAVVSHLLRPPEHTDPENSSHGRRKGHVLKNTNQELTLLLPHPIATTKLFGFNGQSKRKPTKDFIKEGPNRPLLLWPFKQTQPGCLAQLTSGRAESPRAGSRHLPYSPGSQRLTHWNSQQ